MTSSDLGKRASPDFGSLHTSHIVPPLYGKSGQILFIFQKILKTPSEMAQGDVNTIAIILYISFDFPIAPIINVSICVIQFFEGMDPTTCKCLVPIPC